MNYDPLELAQTHAEAVYVHDGNGRMLRVNEPDPEDSAPRFFLIRTPSGNLWRTRFDLPADLMAQLERLAAAEPVLGDLRESPHYLAEYTALIRQHAAISRTHSGPAYYVPELAQAPGTVRITPENAALLSAYFPYTRRSLAERAPVVVVVAEGVAVAACYAARLTARAAAAGVHTEEAYRGRGYAAATVRAWAADVRGGGRLPLYSTSSENRASQAVARKLGAVQYGLDFSIT